MKGESGRRDRIGCNFVPKLPSVSDRAGSAIEDTTRGGGEEVLANLQGGEATASPE